MQLIPSIHKYCDRWCARCSFQERCGFYMARQGNSDEVDWSEGLEEKTATNTPHPFNFWI